MIRPPPRSTRPYTLLPSTTRCRSLETTRKSILLYSASDVAMWRSDELHAHPFLSRLGPDVLDPGLDEAAVEVRMLDPRFAGRSLGGLLLDQRSEERRVGKECVSTFRSRWSRYHQKKNNKPTT